MQSLKNIKKVSRNKNKKSENSLYFTALIDKKRNTVVLQLICLNVIAI